MFIKKLILENFQKHKNLELDFMEGVNIISGKTDSGKSCIRRAISWVFFNEPQGEVIRRENSKKTSVKIILNNNSMVERIKSKSINAYILTIPGAKPKRFDSIGRTLPEEVLKALKIRTINVDKKEIILNIANQIALPFLLDESGTFRNKLFNQLTGNDITDKALQSLNKDILHTNKVEKIEKEHLEEQKINLNELTEKKEKVQVVYDKLLTSYKDLKEKLSTYDKLNDYLKKSNNINDELKIANSKLKEIKIINEDKLLDLDVSINRLEKLKRFSDETKRIIGELFITDTELEAIESKGYVNLEDLDKKIDILSRLQQSKTRLNEIEKEDNKFKDKLTTIIQQIKEGEDKYKELLTKLGICPVCKQEIKNVKEIEL